MEAFVTSIPLWMRLFSIAAIAYFLGGLSFSLIVGKTLYKTDPRLVGSGNLGATNSMRAMGPWGAILVAAGDVGKAVLAVYIAKLLVPLYGIGTKHWMAAAIAGIFVIVGHAFSPFIKFKGGKGVATAYGALLMISFPATLALLAIFVVVIAVSKYVSLSSIVFAAGLPIALAFFMPGNFGALFFGLVAGPLIIWLHRENLGRLLRREERRLSFKRSEESK